MKAVIRGKLERLEGERTSFSTCCSDWGALTCVLIVVVRGLEHSADLREISDLEKFIAERLPEAEGEVAELAATEASSSSSKA